MHSTLIRNDDMEVEANPEIDPVTTKSIFLNRGKFLRKNHKINLLHITSEPPLLTAPWNLTNTLVCNEMTKYEKNDYPTEQLKILFNSHLHIHAESRILYTDGSKTEDGVSYAVVGQRVAISRRIQHEASISTAELCALYDGIRHCQGVAQPSMTLITDSRSSIQALNKYNRSNPLIQKIQCAYLWW